MTEFEHSGEERVSRRRAAERLVEAAHALTTGAAIALDVDGERVGIPVADVVLLESESESRGQRVELDLRLSWLTPEQ